MTSRRVNVPSFLSGEPAADPVPQEPQPPLTLGEVLSGHRVVGGSQPDGSFDLQTGRGSVRVGDDTEYEDDAAQAVAALLLHMRQLGRRGTVGSVDAADPDHID